MHFTAPLFHWHGPAPHYFLRVPDDLAADLKDTSRLVTYGWGMIPVTVQVGGWEYDTSLFPKDGGYLVPIRAEARKAGGWQEGDALAVTLEIRAGKAGRPEENVTLQLCLNGARAKAEHAGVPHTPAELARDVTELFAAGARSFHLHVYRDGQQTLALEAVAATLHAIRAACPEAEIAVSTAEGIAPTPAERTRLISRWTVWPDTLCVNLAEEGIEDVLALAEARGAWLEAGLFTPAEVRRFRALQHLNWRRVLLEPLSDDPQTAAGELRELLDELGDFRADLPRVAHGMDGAAWPTLTLAAQLGLSSRIGFEDVLTLPGGSPPAGNLELYRAALNIMEER